MSVQLLEGTGEARVGRRGERELQGDDDLVVAEANAAGRTKKREQGASTSALVVLGIAWAERGTEEVKRCAAQDPGSRKPID